MCLLPAACLHGQLSKTKLSFLVLQFVCMVVLWGSSVRPAIADSINFDDLDASAGDVVLDGLSPYHGFTWTNFSAYTATPGFPGFNNGIVSGPNAAYLGGGLSGTLFVGTITATNPFNFVSANFGSGWYDGLNLTLSGSLNGTQKFNQTVTVSTNGAQLFNFNFTGINKLQFSSTVTAATTDPYACGPSGCGHATLDNFTFTGPVAVTPEPSTLLLFGSGASLLLGIRRRRKKSSPRS
jgi:hypothetical protein